MGYSTTFKGELKFTTELTAQQLAKVKTFLGEDCRDHPDWDGGDGLTYIDLELLNDFSGLKWDGSEKTYDLVDKVNLVIDLMKKEFPHFGLEGKMLAQGEDIDDRWVLAIENGKAVEKKVIDEIVGEKKTPDETTVDNKTGIKAEGVICPHCKKEFILLQPS